MLDPLASASEEKKQVLAKVEGILDGVYKSDTIESSDYESFMKSYSEDFEAKLKENPDYKFEYTKGEKTEAKTETMDAEQKVEV